MNGDSAENTFSINAQIIRRFLDTLRKTQYLPPERMLAYQRGLLERLVRHARAHVPFYRDTGRLDMLFRGDEIDWSRWGEIPLLTRGEVRRAGEALHAEVLPPDHGTTWTLSTSGSTGEPVTVRHTQIAGSLAWIAVMLRTYERHNIDPTRKIVFFQRFDPDVTDPNSIRTSDCWFPEFGLLGLPGERFDISDTRDIRESIMLLDSLQPDYVLVQPTVLELLCANDRQGRLANLGVKTIITVGEYMSEAARKHAESHFRCRTLDNYSSNECGQMASTCRHCGRYHVHSEVTFLEVIEDDGSATPPGAVGRVIATPLYNYAMPLIRYDHADRAEVAPSGRCPIMLPSLQGVRGKEMIPFFFPGGLAIRPTVPHNRVMEHLGALAFQVAQVAEDRCEFRIVAGDLPESEMRFDEVTRLLRALWWSDLKVDYKIVPSLRRGRHGKLMMYVNEVATGKKDT